MAKREVVWSPDAIKQLNEIYEYLQLNATLLTAKQVILTIVANTRELPKHPERYPKDQLKLNNDGSYHYFKIYNYRISYRIMSDQIRILRIRHAKQEPQSY